MKAPYLFTSLQLIQLCDTITSLKTKMEFIRLLGPRLIDPSSKVSTFLSMFRYNDDKQNVENILRTRQTSLIQSQFIMVENNNNNNSSININNIKNNDKSNDGDHNNNSNSPVKSTTVNARKSSSILSRRIVGGRGSSNRNSIGGSSTIITTATNDAAAAAAAADIDGIIDGSDNSITSSPTASPYASPYGSPSIAGIVAPTAEILSKEGSGIYNKNLNFSNDNTVHLDDVSLSDLNNKDIQFSLVKINEKNSDAQKCKNIHNDVYLNDDNDHCFQVNYGDDDDNDVLFDSRPLASRSSNRQSLAWTNRLNSFVDNHY